MRRIQVSEVPEMTLQERLAALRAERRELFLRLLEIDRAIIRAVAEE